MSKWIPPAPTDAPPEATNTLLQEHGMAPAKVERLAAAFNLLDRDQDNVISAADLKEFYRDDEQDYEASLVQLMNYDEKHSQLVPPIDGTKVDLVTFALACDMHMSDSWKSSFVHSQKLLLEGITLDPSCAAAFRERMEALCDVKLTNNEALRMLETLRKHDGEGALLKACGISSAPPQTPDTAGKPTVRIAQTENPVAGKYLKMLAVGVPRPAVELKIKRDGLDPSTVLPPE